MKRETILVILVILIAIIVSIIFVLTIGSSGETKKDRVQQPIVVEAKPQETEPFVEAKVEKLAPPTKIETESKKGTIYFRWLDTPDAGGYKLYYSDHSQFTKSEARLIEGITSGEFSITKVPSGTYYYRIASIFGEDEGRWSEERIVVVDKCQPLEPPKNLKSTYEKGKKSAVVSWTADPASDGYVLSVYLDQNDTVPTTTINIDSGIISNYKITSLNPKLKYFLTISAVQSHCTNGFESDKVQISV